MKWFHCIRRKAKTPQVEVFIPRDPSRSAGILDQAARWYGGRFRPHEDD